MTHNAHLDVTGRLRCDTKKKRRFSMICTAPLDVNEGRLTSPDDEAEAMDWHEAMETAREEAAERWVDRR